MPLQFPDSWRFNSSPESVIPNAAIDEFEKLTGIIVAKANRWELLEYFKECFAHAVGSTSVWSTSESWASTDLRSYLEDAAKNPSLFLEAFYDACENLRDKYAIPDIERINDICLEHKIAYKIDPPKLVKLCEGEEAISVAEPPATFTEPVKQLIRESLNRSEQLLNENRPREAVIEVLWILESITTAFRGEQLPSGTIKGTYFNVIVKELRNANEGTAINYILKCLESLHGYHSSPTGGGGRHGLDLKEGKPMTLSEGRLFCNLIRSYISFLLTEYERLINNDVSDNF
ncbi:hypothetical protein [Nostoc sp. 2RC]|uniref:hypothetical protein n=1 Tax=Nostoc sp. 2RC TaxID=2485484 RepID=UPI001624FFE7|nr:hypothetical protein [Nostoc sp. 2RC]MBC1241346.1 hypothetical protein [Nostoc sp. 2RC]